MRNITIGSCLGVSNISGMEGLDEINRKRTENKRIDNQHKHN